ncbi:MAG TPA: cytosine permease, partial [Thermoanaerobaculia bacterium]|nr:cytosine permease [Thermoanaerobaculia bacterium]
MDTGLDLEPIAPERRTASFWDVLLLFAGANVVTTTLVTGGSLAPAFSFKQAVLLVIVGTAVGTVPIAVLARLGPRYGLPTMVLLRHPFGRRGAATISLLLILTNFAWIALNNVIAAEAMEKLLGGKNWLWSLAVGGVAVAIAVTGPKAMALFDKVAVPLLAVVGVGITWALFGAAGRAALSR